jgi:hypothetical protein
VLCYSSVTAGTVMHATRTPLRTWFWAAYLVATHHPGISAKQLQRQPGLSRYETAWLILQKPRRAMIAPERGLLIGEVEIDEFFLGGHENGLKGGRQHGKKALIDAVIEVRGQGSGRLRLQVLPSSQAATVRATSQLRGRRALAAAGASRDLQPQGLDARHPPRRLRRAPAGRLRRPRPRLGAIVHTEGCSPIRACPSSGYQRPRTSPNRLCGLVHTNCSQ